jgi:hypothetical protein
MYDIADAIARQKVLWSRLMMIDLPEVKMTHIQLTDNQRMDIAARTIAPRAFHFIIARALKKRESLSVVRMGDGEYHLLQAIKEAQAAGNGDQCVTSFDKAWRERMGIDAITWDELDNRIKCAARKADYFCPSISGLTNHNYCLYPLFERSMDALEMLVDNFWCNDFTSEMRVELLKSAGKGLVFHRNPTCANTFARRAMRYLGVELVHIPLSSWCESEDALAEASNYSAREYPLALVSGGPANKILMPMLASQGRVALDLGNAMDHWLLSEVQRAAGD